MKSFIWMNCTVSATRPFMPGEALAGVHWPIRFGPFYAAPTKLAADCPKQPNRDRLHDSLSSMQRGYGADRTSPWFESTATPDAFLADR
ncbi:hypothetical protein Pla52o_11390 [Novipirellula galeiformis]|uniref:Uncharacterized protein n=1 Tax=Novipirellula galeiformis TaxID=2528004 RepID=A0A5C6CK69_9BACT|nr:hypothetical protein [Novipirellula galeiformis]TWU24848.1 hypothetical protein Pla52o_11390 [Novipirellula galeiformis]